MAHQREIHEFVGAQAASIGGAAAPIGHDRAALAVTEHARHRTSVLAHGSYVGIAFECVEHRVEKRLRKHRRPEIADAGCTDALIVAALGGVAAGRRAVEHTSDYKQLMRTSNA